MATHTYFIAGGAANKDSVRHSPDGTVPADAMVSVTFNDQIALDAGHPHTPSALKRALEAIGLHAMQTSLQDG
ncbi:MAG: hypothetical protein AAFV47_09225 [Pseudomonadota bacterium]